MLLCAGWRANDTRRLGTYNSAVSRYISTMPAAGCGARVTARALGRRLDSLHMAFLASACAPLSDAAMESMLDAEMAAASGAAGAASDAEADSDTETEADSDTDTEADSDTDSDDSELE